MAPVSNNQTTSNEGEQPIGDFIPEHSSEDKNRSGIPHVILPSVQDNDQMNELVPVNQNSRTSSGVMSMNLSQTSNTGATINPENAVRSLRVRQQRASVP